eukprot:6118077-Amphidinium_carterae.1
MHCNSWFCGDGRCRCLHTDFGRYCTSIDIDIDTTGTKVAGALYPAAHCKDSRFTITVTLDYVDTNRPCSGVLAIASWRYGCCCMQLQLLNESRPCCTSATKESKLRVRHSCCAVLSGKTRESCLCAQD